MHTALVSLLAMAVLGAACRAAEPLVKLTGCTRPPAEWADGDSFPVMTADGTALNIRLYGVDCPEWHVRDDTDARRLRAQRQWFGITDIHAARELGRQAAEQTAQWLAQPFTIHTAYADGRGDPRFKRVYAFITTAGGDDLAGLLVAHGLARAYGVYRTTPDGGTRDEYRARLGDLELQAAKRGLGAWRLTNWERLPEERRLARAEEAELTLAQAAPADDQFVIDPNTAARDELMRLPGIGENLANRIIEARPFARIEDLDRVAGIGPKTIEALRPHLKLGTR
jgi:competence protein ComEA